MVVKSKSLKVAPPSFSRSCFDAFRPRVDPKLITNQNAWLKNNRRVTFEVKFLMHFDPPGQQIAQMQKLAGITHLRRVPVPHDSC